MESLLSKYRPKNLKGILGQSEVVRSLALFVKNPYPAALLFHGESGTGKTSCAMALANDLGCAVDDGALGGFLEIASGEQTADTIRRTMDHLRFRPLMGSGWRVLVVNESDRLSAQAEVVWLDALEHLPPQSIIVFTTNAPERLSKRFRDRCEVYAFESSSDKLREPIQALAKRIWKAEVGRGAMPAFEDLGMPTLGSMESLHASFRLALQQLTRLIRQAALGGRGGLNSAKRQLRKDYLVTEQETEAACDHCGHRQDVPKGVDKHVCEKCGRAFELTW